MKVTKKDDNECRTEVGNNEDDDGKVIMAMMIVDVFAWNEASNLKIERILLYH